MSGGNGDGEWGGRLGWPVRGDLEVNLPDGYELREDRDCAYLYAPDGRLVFFTSWPLATPAALEAAARRDCAGGEA